MVLVVREFVRTRDPLNTYIGAQQRRLDAL